MVRLLAMVLTAFDPRRNPAVGCLLRSASQCFDSLSQHVDALWSASQDRDSLVQYPSSYGARSASDVYYTKNGGTMCAKRPMRYQRYWDSKTKRIECVLVPCDE